MTLLIYISSILFVSIPKEIMHPIHVSIAHIEWSDNMEKVTAFFKIYKDDFETIINQKYNVGLQIENEESIQNCMPSVKSYINDCFQINCDEKKKIMFNFDKFETDDEAIWLYFDISGLQDVSKVTFTNTLMMDLYIDQTNLMIISKGEKQEGYSFDIANKKIEVEFENN